MSEKKTQQRYRSDTGNVLQSSSITRRVKTAMTFKRFWVLRGSPLLRFYPDSRLNFADTGERIKLEFGTTVFISFPTKCGKKVAIKDLFAVCQQSIEISKW